jgi:predicted transcriptional regulator
MLLGCSARTALRTERSVDVMERLSDQVCVRLTATERTELEQLAREECRSLGYVAREGIRRLVEERRKTVAARAR